MRNKVKIIKGNIAFKNIAILKNIFHFILFVLAVVFLIRYVIVFRIHLQDESMDDFIYGGVPEYEQYKMSLDFLEEAKEEREKFKEVEREMEEYLNDYTKGN